MYEKIAVRGEPGQSYALYLPSGFDRAAKWPVLFLFDPGARGAIAVTAFREAAEKYGWILIGSNNSRNGPWEPIARAAWTMWNDVRELFPADPKRIYAGGFSGGARAASYFSRVINHPVAGIIACGAGLNSALKPADIRPSSWLGLVGLADFNYREMRGLDAAFDGARVEHRLLVFEGRHDWPSPSLCGRAAGWMELLAMRNGARPRDEALIDGFIRTETEDAAAHESAGRIFWAADRLDALIARLGGLRESWELEIRLENLTQGKDYRRFLKEDGRREEQETAIKSDFARAFAEIEAETPGAVRILEIVKEMGLAALKSAAEKPRTIEDGSLASRVLFDLCYSAESKATEYYERNDLAKAAAFLELGIAACEMGNPRAKYLFFDLASVAARRGEEKKALKYLAEAINRGFADAETMESAKSLEKLRDKPEYRRLLEKIKTR